MARSLRAFLDRAGSDSFTSGSQPAVFANAVQSDLFINRCTQVCNTDYNKNCFCYWKIPGDAKVVTYEAWGGGGGGAGACGCAFGWPGGAGAYAKVNLDMSVEDYTNTCYTVCVGSATCCSPSDSCGFRGNNSFVNGNGLSNFCAEGGLPGCTLYCMNGCFPTNNECGVFPHPCYVNCACYYGADTGIPGRHGFLYANQRSDDDWCFYHEVIPAPGGINGSICPVYAVQGFGCNVNSYTDRCRPGTIIDNMAGGAGELIAVGMGGSSARACTDGCCCGAAGGPGLVKISWTT